jgi:hypothetical protein
MTHSAQWFSADPSTSSCVSSHRLIPTHSDVLIFMPPSIVFQEPHQDVQAHIHPTRTAGMDSPPPTTHTPSPVCVAEVAHVVGVHTTAASVEGSMCFFIAVCGVFLLLLRVFFFTSNTQLSIHTFSVVDVDTQMGSLSLFACAGDSIVSVSLSFSLYLSLSLSLSLFLSLSSPYLSIATSGAPPARTPAPQEPLAAVELPFSAAVLELVVRVRVLFVCLWSYFFSHPPTTSTLIQEPYLCILFF